MVSIDRKLAELRVKRENARQGGGAEKLKSLQEKGKLSARERVLKLFDHEGQIREKMMERREKMGPPPGRGPSIDVQ